MCPEENSLSKGTNSKAKNCVPTGRTDYVSVHSVEEIAKLIEIVSWICMYLKIWKAIESLKVNNKIIGHRNFINNRDRSRFNARIHNSCTSKYERLENIANFIGKFTVILQVKLMKLKQIWFFLIMIQGLCKYLF